MPNADRSDTAPIRRWTRTELVLLAAIVLYYFVITPRFRTFNLDNPWFASFSYNWWHNGILTDTLMNRRFPHGMGGVEVFGKLPAAIQGLVCGIFGWRLPVLRVVSTAFVSAALVLLADTSRRLGKSPHFTACVIVIGGLLEPFADTASTVRYEFLLIFLLTLALWFASRGEVFLSILAAGIALESHPAAIVPFACAVLFVLMQDMPAISIRRKVTMTALATLCSAAFYLLLHPYIVHTFRNADWLYVSAIRTFGGFAIEYTLRYKRHYVETAILVAAIAVAIRRKPYLLRQWPALAIGLIFVLSAILRWNNPHYWIVAVPFLAFFLTDVFLTPTNWKQLIVVIAVCTLPLTIYREVDFGNRAPELSSADQQQIDAALSQAALSQSDARDPRDLRVTMDSYLWFAHPDHMLALDARTVQPGEAVPGDIMVCAEKKLDPTLRDRSTEWKCSDLDGIPATAQHLTLRGYGFRVVPLQNNHVTARMPEWLKPYLKSGRLPDFNAH